MTGTFTHPTRDQMTVYLRRGERARSEAFAALLHRIWIRLTRRRALPAGARCA
ncbi:MAG: hypothetical protein ACFCUO_11400 [Rhodospirillales bacterium]